MKTKILIPLLLSLFLIFIGCAGKHWEEFETKIKKMSDSELLDYYKTVSISLKGAQYGDKSDPSDPIVSDSNRDDENMTSVKVSNQYYDLDKKARIAKKEIRRRNLQIPGENKFIQEKWN